MVVVCIVSGWKSASMFVSGLSINLQVAFSVQLQLYKALCDRASNNSHEKYTGQVYQQELDQEKSNATRQISILL